jgi:hypothetical protein
MGRVRLTRAPVDGTHPPVTDDRLFKSLTILAFYEIAFFFRETGSLDPVKGVKAMQAGVFGSGSHPHFHHPKEREKDHE